MRRIMQMLDKIISQGQEKFVIYPFGEMGRLVEWILTGSYGLRPEYIIDNKNYDGIHVLNMEQAQKRDNEGICVLICSCREECYQEIRDAAKACFLKEQIVDLFPRQGKSSLLTEAEVLILLKQIDQNLERLGIDGTDYKYSEV